MASKLGGTIQFALTITLEQCQRPPKLPYGTDRVARNDHMVASLDGFIARRDGSVDWLETTDTFDDGKGMDPELVTQFLTTIGCYVMRSRTYETALAFEAKGFGWAYSDTRRLSSPAAFFRAGEVPSNSTQEISRSL